MDIHIMAVLLEESPDDIDKEAANIFQEYGVGGTTHGAKGVLFLIDPAGKQVRIEIGYDLEPIFTDGVTGYIERRQMTPFFLKKGRQGWMMDFASMNRLVGFNHKNQWHLKQRNHNYMFGFKEVYFDKNGFPHKK